MNLVSQFTLGFLYLLCSDKTDSIQSE